MLPLVLLLVGVPLLLLGGEGLYYATRDRQPKTIACDRYLRERPDATWLRLGNCEIDYLGAAYRETSSGAITELFFPVRPIGQQRTAPTAIIMATRDRTALDTAQQTIGAGKQADQEQFLVMMLKIVTNLRASREINGYVRRSFLERLQAQRLVSGLGVPVDSSFIVIDLYGQPSIELPAILAGSGAVSALAGLALLVRGRRGRREPDVALPMPIEAGPPAVHLPPARYRGLMLLNLPPTATPAMVESAPPLGGRAEVVHRLRAAMPGILADERGRCVYTRPDCSALIDLGPGEPVATAVVDAEGDGAGALLRAILETSGWRLFAPRLGTFVDPDHLEHL